MKFWVEPAEHHEQPPLSTIDRTPYLLDDRRRGVALFYRLEDDRPAARFDGVTPHDLIRRPVGTLHEDVGLDSADDVGRGVVVEDRNGVDAGERREDLGALVLGVDRPLGALVAAHRRVGIESNDQQVAVRPRGLQVADVAGMQQVEHAVREHDAAARGPRVADETREPGGVEDPHDVGFLNLTSPVKCQVWRGR